MPQSLKVCHVTGLYSEDHSYSSCLACRRANNQKWRKSKAAEMVNSPTYTSWQAMRCRVNSKIKKKWYKGIKVCDRWDSFENFLADMGHRPAGMSLDRINNRGDYEPSNCRWATPQEQMINRECVRLFSYKGKMMTKNEISALTGLPYWTVQYRLENQKKTVQEILNEAQEKADARTD